MKYMYIPYKLETLSWSWKTVFNLIWFVYFRGYLICMFILEEHSNSEN